MEIAVEAKLPEVYVADLTQAWLGILSRAKHTRSHEVIQETISVRAQMTAVLRRLNESGICKFSDLFKPEQGAAYVVVNFIALLELAKEGLVRIVQPDSYGEIEISLKQENLERPEAEEGISDDPAADVEGETA